MMRSYDKNLLYVWGSNSHGQLGLGFSNEQVLEPVLVEDLPESLNENCIKEFCGGGGHSLILTTDGQIYGAGWNENGQIGNGTQTKSVPIFEQIRGLEDQIVISVACGWTHSIALTSQGQVWVWGSNSHSQLGIPYDEVPFSCLPICLQLSNIRKISAGLRHTVVINNEGKVFSWGHGHKGQLGHLDESGKIVKRQETPKLIQLIEEKVSAVVCGQNTTYAKTTHNRIMAWGDNRWGQLAHDPSMVDFFPYPVLLPVNYFGNSELKFLRAGWTHCVAKVKRENKEYLYAWGRSNYGQLGLPSNPQEFIIKEELHYKISTPLENTTKSHGSDVNKICSKIEVVSPKRSHTQLKKLCRYVPFKSFVDCHSIIDVRCGSEHNIAIIALDDIGTNKVICWGWNEHGSCGNGTMDDQYQYCFPNISGTAKVVGAGCGTSFAVMSQNWNL